MDRYARQLVFFAIAAGCFVTVSGCGEKKSVQASKLMSMKQEAASKEAAAAKDHRSSAKTWDPTLGSATIKGVVRLSGKPPRRRSVDMRAKPICAQQHIGDELAAHRDMV